MTRRGFNTLKLERNVARAPIWASRAGVPIQQALDWPDLPFHGEPFHIAELTGTLGPTDLLVFTRVCTLYAATRPSDRRVEVSLAEIARWTSNAAIGGSQHRSAVACLNRLRGATFISSVRIGAKGSEQFLRGWGLIDEWLMPERGRHVGSVRVSSAIADLVDAKSVVLLDARTFEILVRRSGLAARLWVYLEADTLSETGVTEQGQPYPVFAARRGEPPPERARPAIADLCRLLDPRRRRTVALLRRACEIIEELDSRYRLSISPSARGREGLWNLWARRWRTKAPLARYGLLGVATWGTLDGKLGDGTPASQGTERGTPGDAAEVVAGAERDGHSRGNRAIWGTQPATPRRASPVESLDGLLQTMPASEIHLDQSDAIRRDRSILEDPDAPSWKKEAALAHLAQLRVPV